MIESLGPFRHRQQERAQHQEPQFEVGHHAQFGWGELLVSEAAQEAYGLAPHQALGNNDEPRPPAATNKREFSPLPLKVWIISPSENAEYNHEFMSDRLMPISGVRGFVTSEQALVVAGLSENRHAATQNVLHAFGNQLGLPDEEIREQMALPLPTGEISAEEAIEYTMPTSMLIKVCDLIHAAAAKHHADQDRLFGDKEIIRRTTQVGFVGLATAGVEVVTGVLLGGNYEAVPLAGAGGLLLYTTTASRSIQKTYARHRSLLEQGIRRQSEIYAKNIVTDVLTAHDLPGIDRAAEA